VIAPVAEGASDSEPITTRFSTSSCQWSEHDRQGLGITVTLTIYPTARRPAGSS
jgi:hypothetical protein